MTAAEQLAEMAANNSSNVDLRLIEYRTVLSWFCGEVERRAKGACNPLGGYPMPEKTCEYHIGEAMTELLHELNLDCCPRCVNNEPSKSVNDIDAAYERWRVEPEPGGRSWPDTNGSRAAFIAGYRLAVNKEKKREVE